MRLSEKLVHISSCESSAYKYYLIMIKNSFSPKMCRKKFENRFTNKNLVSINVLEY